MKRGRAFALVSVLVVAFLLNAGLARAETPEVTILPDEKIVSLNSSILIRADPKTSETPMRVTWSVYNTGNIGLGSFPMTDGKGLCYFSNYDGNATCGPSPFFQVGETELYVYVVTPTRTLNKTIYLNISPVSIPLDGVNRVDNTIYMYLFMGKKDWMKYSIYKEDLSIYQSERPLDYEIIQGRYAGNITLNPGVYYFAFVVNDSGSYGSALKRIEIPSGDYLTLKAEKADYWKGERVRISGITSASFVSGEVLYPDGMRALSFTADAAANRTFSYEFYSKSDWPEGSYQVKTSKPLEKTAGFSLTEFLELAPEAISDSVNKSHDFTTSIRVKNLRSNATTITFATSGGMNDEYVTIADPNLSPQETTTITIDIPSVEANVNGQLTLKTSDGLELAVPVSVAIIQPGQACTAAVAIEIDKESLVWSQECVANGDVYHTVKISNNGAMTLSDFSYEADDAYNGGLEDLDRMGYLDVPLSGVSIGPGESKEIEIKATPSGAGKYQGTLAFRSGGNSALMFVSLNCFEDISGSLSDLTAKLAELSLTADAKEGISSDISNAESAIPLGNYEQANEYYLSANAKVEMAEAGGVAAPLDLTMPMIIIVVVVVAIVFLWFFKFRKPKAGKAEGEDELESFA